MSLPFLGSQQEPTQPFAISLRKLQQQLGGIPGVNGVDTDPAGMAAVTGVLGSFADAAKTFRRSVTDRFSAEGDLWELPSDQVGVLQAPQQRCILVQTVDGERGYLMQNGKPVAVNLTGPIAEYENQQLPGMLPNWSPRASTTSCVAVVSTPDRGGVFTCEHLQSGAAAGQATSNILDFIEHRPGVPPLGRLTLRLSGRLGDISVSGDQRRIAVLDRNGEDATIHVIRIGGEDDSNLVLHRQFQINGTTRIAFHPNGKWILGMSSKALFAQQAEQNFVHTVQIAKLPDLVDTSGCSGGLHISKYGDSVLLRSEQELRQGRKSSLLSVLDLSDFDSSSHIRATFRHQEKFVSSSQIFKWSAFSPTGTQFALVDEDFNLSIRSAESPDLPETARAQLPAKPLMQGVRRGDLSLSFVDRGRAIAVGMLCRRTSGDPRSEVVLIRGDAQR